MVQEYGRYFEMPTVCFRGGCLTGPNHAGAQLHGFLAYLMRCTVTGDPYTVFGYGGKQVRDNIHSADVVSAFDAFHRAPRDGRGLQPRRRAGEQLLDARGDRALRADRRARARLGAVRPGADGRPPLVDQRPERRSRPTTPTGSSSTTSRRCCARSTSGTWSSGRPWSEALGRHPGPQRGGLDRRDPRRPRRCEREAGIDYEIIVVDDVEHRPDAGRRRAHSARRTHGCATTARTTRAASASRSAPGSTSSRATRSRS